MSSECFEQAARRDRTATILGIAVGAVCGLLWLLHVLLLFHSGAFWRDECSSILLSRIPTWSGVWKHMASDSFPGLFVSVLRLWIQSGLGANDFGIRLMGIAISLGMLASVFFSCRAMQSRFPLLALSLLGLNSAVFYRGCSIRAYGLAALLIVACFAAFWRVAVRPTRLNSGLAFLLAVLSAHCNYQNSYMLFGIGAAAAAIAAIHGNWKRSALILAMCCVAALSMAVYVPTIAHYRSEVITSNYRLGLEMIVGTFLGTLAANGILPVLGWFAGTCMLVCAVVKRLLRTQAASDVPGPAAGVSAIAVPRVSESPSPGLYCLLTVILAAIAGMTFFRIGGMYPYPWHYIPFVAICGMAIECGVGCTCHGGKLWSAKIFLAGYVAAVSLPGALHSALLRRTNMDLAVAVLEKKSEANDLILVNPFWMCPSFQQYYHGPAPWRTVPVDPRDTLTAWQSEDFSIKNIMADPDSIRPTLDAAEKILRGGGKVWIVGDYSPLPDGARPPKLIPAPHPDYGWNQNAYAKVWLAHLSEFLRRHAENPETVAVESNGSVDHLENVRVYVFQGWRNISEPPCRGNGCKP
jgi:hypothetical protein